MGIPGVRMRWKFLFIKFRNDVHWFAWMVMIYLIMVGVFMPWRQRIVNLVDAWCQISLIFLTSSMQWFAADGIEDPKELESLNNDMARTVVVASVMFLFALPFGGAYLYWDSTAAGPVAKRDKDRENLQTAVGLMAGDPQGIKAFWETLQESDRYFCKHAAKVILQEYGQFACRSGLSSKKLSTSAPVKKPVDPQVSQTTIKV